MIKRALLCGLGKSYSQAGLPELPLELDIQCIIKRLNHPGLAEKWESIDVIDDSRMSVFDGEKNKIISANDLMPTKDNIFKSIEEILDKECDLLMFYFSGHGLRVGKLYMIIYDEDYFKIMKLTNDRTSPPEGKMITEEQYIDLINDKLDIHSQLNVISIIDCCFSGSIIKRFLSINKHPLRHIILCAVGHREEARGDGFTKKLCQAAGTSNTYSEMENSLFKISGSPKPVLYIPNEITNNVIQL